MDQFVELLRQYGFLFTILGGVVTALGVVFAIYKAGHDKQVRFLNGRIHGLEQELKTAREAGDPVILKDQNAQLLHANGQLQNQLGAAASDQLTLRGSATNSRAGSPPRSRPSKPNGKPTGRRLTP